MKQIIFSSFRTRLCPSYCTQTSILPSIRSSNHLSASMFLLSLHGRPLDCDSCVTVGWIQVATVEFKWRYHGDCSPSEMKMEEVFMLTMLLLTLWGGSERQNGTGWPDNKHNKRNIKCTCYIYILLHVIYIYMFQFKNNSFSLYCVCYVSQPFKEEEIIICNSELGEGDSNWIYLWAEKGLHVQPGAGCMKVKWKWRFH